MAQAGPPSAIKEKKVFQKKLAKDPTTQNWGGRHNKMPKGARLGPRKIRRMPR